MIFRSKAKLEAAAETRRARRKAVQGLVGLSQDASQERRAEFLELYKMMVQSSEALVSRRQNVNTFFVTANGFLLSGVALVAKDGVPGNRIAIALMIMSFVGLITSLIWRQLLLSFGQLNAGKFMVINAMEQHLAAPLYDAEWIALAEGRDKTVYRSFTDNEARVPLVILAVYFFIFVVTILILTGWIGSII